MAQEIPEAFYLVVHDFSGAYAAKPSTNEGPLPTTAEEALNDLLSALSNWPSAKWSVLRADKAGGIFILADVSQSFVDILDERERESRRELADPQRHSLDALRYYNAGRRL
jgi:hypothetical protein